MEITSAEQEKNGEGAGDIDEGPAMDEQAGSGAAFPEVLHDEAPAGPGGLSRWIWSASVLVLLVTGVIQVAWFNRDEVLSRYSRLAPWIGELCDRLQCDVIRRRDVTAIKLINRDVREHPRYQNTLLVNATMVNGAGTAQPFPRVRLTLFDTNGKLVAHRIFEPGDYLDESIDLVMGMQPDQPVHFVLEVTGPPTGAESFEFRFL